MSDFDGIYRTEDGAELPYLIDPNTGDRRILACLPSPEDRGGLPKFSASGLILDPSKYVEVDNSWLGVPILDQNGYRSCTPHGAVGALMTARAIRGAVFQLLSASYIYSWINGGRDAGSSPSDALQILLTKGTCFASQCPESMIYRREIPSSADQTALRFRAVEGYHADTYEGLLSGIMQDYFPFYGVAVGRSFMAGNLSADGIAPFSSGPVNHCMYGNGAKNINGQWCVINVNSWGPRWGRNGCCYLTKRHFYESGMDCCLIKVTMVDTEETNQPPPLTSVA